MNVPIFLAPSLRNSNKEKRTQIEYVHSAQIFRTFINNKDSILSNPCICMIYSWYHKLIEESTRFAFELRARALNIDNNDDGKKTHFDLCFVLCMYVLRPLPSLFPLTKTKRLERMVFSVLSTSDSSEGPVERTGRRKKRKWRQTSENILQMHKAKRICKFPNCTPPKRGRAFIFCPKKISCYSYYSVYRTFGFDFHRFTFHTFLSADDSFDKCFLFVRLNRNK